MNFTLSTTGEEGLTLLKASESIPSGDSGDTDDCMGKHTAWQCKVCRQELLTLFTKPWNNAALLQRIGTALELAGCFQRDNAGAE